MIALSLALLSLAIWLMLVFARGNFWQARETDDLLPPFGTDAGRIRRIVAIVPALMFPWTAEKRHDFLEQWSGWSAAGARSGACRSGRRLPLFWGSRRRPLATAAAPGEGRRGGAAEGAPRRRWTGGRREAAAMLRELQQEGSRCPRCSEAAAAAAGAEATCKKKKKKKTFELFCSFFFLR